jgi:hypothetical protein
MLTPYELEFWSERYQGPKSHVPYAHAEAIKYAERHAPNAPATVKHAISLAVFRYMLEFDAGEKTLLRAAVDALIGIGRPHANASA